jgi:hypothetical protein
VNLNFSTINVRNCKLLIALFTYSFESLSAVYIVQNLDLICFPNIKGQSCGRAFSAGWAWLQPPRTLKLDW